MNFKVSLLISVSILTMAAGQASAQRVNELSPNVIEGVRITSNNDNNPSSGEYFEVVDANDTVFYGEGDEITRVSNRNQLVLRYDSDNNNSGTFSLLTGGDSVLTANNAGAITVHNGMTTNGINNGNDGITNAGAISGVTTLTASGAASVVGLNNNAGGITNAGAVGGVTTLDVSGLSTLNGINNSNDGITNAGAISGVTTVTASGAASVVGLNNNTGGITNAGAVSGVTTLTASGLSSLNGIDNDNDGITNAGAISGVTTLTASGAASVNGLNNNAGGITNAGAVSGVTTLNVSGASTQNGIDNSNGGITNAGAVAGVTTLDVSGLATLNGGAVINDALSVDSNGATAGGSKFAVSNTAVTSASSNGYSTTNVNDNNVTIGHNNGVNNNNIVVGATQSGAIGANTFNYGTTVNGGMMVEGDLGVNGSIYALNPTANTGINVANNGLAISGSNNTATLLADSNNTAGDGRGQITLQEDQASFYVYNQQNGNAHGLAIAQSKTVLSGGTQTTTLTLDDGGATFHNSISGGAARVTGVADGKTDFDAVNFRQLRAANAGVASVSAMANIPAPAAGKRFALGMGYGNFESENAVAVGATAVVTESVSVKTSFGHSNGSNVVGAGVGFSW